MKCYKKDYPRPQFVRKDWENLNGIWDFAFDDLACGEKEKWFLHFPKHRTICVPFTYETKMSGIFDENQHNTIWYHRQFKVDTRKLESYNYVLHFEGSDFITKVWINGCFAGSHRGGYTRFSLDVSLWIKEGTNELTVKVEDSYDTQQPRGKQRWLKNSFGCWYVQTTGIWKTVWAEYVPKISLSHIKMTPDMKNGALDLKMDLNFPGEIKCLEHMSLQMKICISFRGISVNSIIIKVNSSSLRAKIDLYMETEECFEWGIMQWSPQDPKLYDISFYLMKEDKVLDEVSSYFGMREIRIDGKNILLNGRPLYQRLILDQGYWPDSHLTPPDEEALIEDIDKIKLLGYNGVRKHQKIEDERFAYWCDVKGLLVWNEAPAAYRFTDYAVKEFTEEWIEIVQQNYNHPCIITWTPFNESWGINLVKIRKDMQHFTEAIYHLTKSIDPYRPVIVNDGWEHTISDIITLHDYEEEGITLKERYQKYEEQIFKGEKYHNGDRAAFAEGYQYKGQPVIISEFGGIAFDNDNTGWGYGNKVKTQDEFLQRFECITTAVKQLPYVCGYCYTQVSDVQQEMNGLLDADRNFKTDPDKIREINERRVRSI